MTLVAHAYVISLVGCAGDNMLTALSVARECGMVDCTDKIILVQAYEPEARSAVPEIEFFYADDRDKKVEEINVCVTAATIFFNSPPPLTYFPLLVLLEFRSLSNGTGGEVCLCYCSLQMNGFDSS